MKATVWILAKVQINTGDNTPKEVIVDELAASAKQITLDHPMFGLTSTEITVHEQKPKTFD